MREEYAQFLEHIPHVKRLSQLYTSYKRDNNLMDYDDLILLFRRLLEENGQVREELSLQYRYVMVDEYQDTNAVQADIVKYLASGHRNVMVVGDDSQSIYSFRGANYKNMFDFPKRFPGTKIIKLEQNYRSTQPILSFTNAIMSHAQETYTKCLFTQRLRGALPKVLDTSTEPEQAMAVCRSIKEEVGQGKSLRDMAILFRAAYHSFELEMELAKQGIPFVKYGGFKFMESAHIKDLLAHLRVVANRYDTVSWGRILRLVRNIGQGKSQAIIRWIKDGGVLPWQVSEWPGAGKGDNGLGALSHVLGKLCHKEISPDRAVDLAIDYYEPILQSKYDDFPRRERDLRQLVSMAGRYKGLRSFLDDVVLDPPTSLVDLRPKKDGDYLTLSTVHSAKGLEWQVVHIIWVVDGYFPSSRAYSNEESLEEERRLMYVAATRAKDRLVLYYPGRESRPVWSDYGGAGAGYRGGLSSFISALPRDVFDSGSTALFNRHRGTEPAYQEAAYPVQHKRRAEGFRPGDRVNHPAFGRGVISKFLGKEKVEVLFREAGRKLLHLEHTTLEKV
jgi:DNA helicase-2/ATP-dependent DNA helicase PcrA